MVKNCTQKFEGIGLTVISIWHGTDKDLIEAFKK